MLNLGFLTSSRYVEARRMLEDIRQHRIRIAYGGMRDCSQDQLAQVFGFFLQLTAHDFATFVNRVSCAHLHLFAVLVSGISMVQYVRGVRRAC